MRPFLAAIGPGFRRMTEKKEDQMPSCNMRHFGQSPHHSGSMRTYLALVRFAALVAALALPGFGQGTTGTVGGRILDSTGSPVPGAAVRLVNQATSDTRSLQTVDDGSFVFINVQPGTYTLTAQRAGFKRFEKTNLVLAPDDRLAAGDLKLDVGDVTETVQVVAQGSAVQVDSSERSALIDSRQIAGLMSKGRDVMSLLQLLPGAVDDTTPLEVLGSFKIPSMGGSRNLFSALNVDGISGNNTGGDTGQTPINMDAIAEVKVLTNSYPAEYGTASGTVVNIVTKGGSRTFSGSAYYYNRNEAFNANNFFNNRQGVARQRYRYNTVGYNLGGPIYIPGKFNASKQKLFFFFSQEILPNQSPNALRTFTVPNELERKGDFSQSYKTCTTGAACQLFVAKDPTTGLAFPGNVVPQSRMDPNSAKLLTVFPLPNATNPAITKYSYNYQIAGTADTPAMQQILRVDYNISDKARLWTRASGHASHNKGTSSPLNSNTWGSVVDYQQRMPNFGGTFTYIFTPTLINEATAGMNLWFEDQIISDQELARLQRTTYGINIPQAYPKNNLLNLLPASSFSGVSSQAQIQYGGGGRFPAQSDSKAITFTDNLTKVWRSHRFKAGITYQRGGLNQWHRGDPFAGSFAFGTDSNNPLDTGYAYANAFIGVYSTYTEATNRIDFRPVTPVFEWYGQDSWKVTRRLTLDVGMRFSWALPATVVNKVAATFVPSLFDPAQAPRLFTPVKVSGVNRVINPITGAVVPNTYSGLQVPGSGNPANGMVASGTNGFPNGLLFSRGVLYGPRFGLAWDPFGNGKTAVRLGGGIFYNTRSPVGALGNMALNPPFVFSPTSYYGYVSQAANTGGLLAPSTLNPVYDPHAKNISSYHSTFGIQRSLGWATVLDVAYVGTFGRHLGEQVQINTVPYGAQFLPQNQNPQTNTPLNDNYFRPYPGYNNIPQQIFEGNSSYHSLQTKLDRRFAKGLQFSVVYTFSKAMSYAEGDSATTGTEATVARYLDRKFWNYSLASLDRPHILTFSFLWDLPQLGSRIGHRITKAVLDGWQISNITSFLNGAPTTVSMGTSPAINFVGGGDGVRPIMIGNPILPKNERTFDRYFNVAAFGEPTPLTPGQISYSPTWLNYGNMTRFPLHGPGTNNWSTSLFKNFTVHERLRFQFRAEAYNLFNHTQYSAVNTTITFNAAGQNTNAAAGQVTAARAPRVMQLALRVVF